MPNATSTIRLCHRAFPIYNCLRVSVHRTLFVRQNFVLIRVLTIVWTIFVCKVMGGSSCYRLLFLSFPGYPGLLL